MRQGPLGPGQAQEDERADEQACRLARTRVRRQEAGNPPT